MGSHKKKESGSESTKPAKKEKKDKKAKSPKAIGKPKKAKEKVKKCKKEDSIKVVKKRISPKFTVKSVASAIRHEPRWKHFTKEEATAAAQEFIDQLALQKGPLAEHPSKKHSSSHMSADPDLE